MGTVARTRANALGLPACLKAQRDCSADLETLHRYFHTIPPFTGALIALPILAGMFWTAPLVSREYEAGTHRLAWTQSVSPLRWITTKVVLIFGCIAAATVALSLLAVWALNPLMPAFGGRYNSTWFDIQGLVPVACMLFALSLGLAASALIRRTIPAMAVTLAVYAVARIPIHFVRAHFWPPTTRTFNVPLVDLVRSPIGSPADDFGSRVGPGDWFLKGSVTDPSGHPIRVISEQRRHPAALLLRPRGQPEGRWTSRRAAVVPDEAAGPQPSREDHLPAGDALLARPGRRERVVPARRRAPRRSGHLRGHPATACVTRLRPRRLRTLTDVRTRVSRLDSVVVGVQAERVARGVE